MSIQTEITRLESAKAAIKTAIEGKGVTVPAGTLLDGMAALIESIEAGGGGATEPYVEETYDSKGNLTAAVLHGHLVIRDYMFANCGLMENITIPDSITHIGESAFRNCNGLTSVTIPNSVTSIGDYVFFRCDRLTSVTFNGTPNSISSVTFYRCSRLTTVNVPWAEGAVSGAPWGATDATINYNYTGA